MATVIYKGDSTNVYNIKVNGETDYSLYSCQGIIVKSIGDTPIVNKTFTLDETDGFDVFFLAEETDLLEIGTYLEIYELTKTESGEIVYRRELQRIIQVKKDGI